MAIGLEHGPEGREPSMGERWAAERRNRRGTLSALEAMADDYDMRESLAARAEGECAFLLDVEQPGSFGQRQLAILGHLPCSNATGCNVFFLRDPETNETLQQNSCPLIPGQPSPDSV